MTATDIPNSNALKVTIKALRPDHRGQPYSVSFNGQTIIPKSHVPSHDACRCLVGLGFSGPLDVWADQEAYPRLRVGDIKRAAKWTVKEGVNHGPRLSAYIHFDRAAFERRLEVS